MSVVESYFEVIWKSMQHNRDGYNNNKSIVNGLKGILFPKEYKLYIIKCEFNNAKVLFCSFSLFDLTETANFGKTKKKEEIRRLKQLVEEMQEKRTATSA